MLSFSRSVPTRSFSTRLLIIARTSKVGRHKIRGRDSGLQRVNAAVQIQEGNDSVALKSEMDQKKKEGGGKGESRNFCWSRKRATRK